MRKRIADALQASSEHHLPEGHFFNALEDHFSQDETERQRDIAIHWRWSAELFEFDEGDEVNLAKTEPVRNFER